MCTVRETTHNQTHCYEVKQFDWHVRD